MKIYIASKANLRAMWREKRDAGININSRWIDVDDKYSVDPTGLNYMQLWRECVEDVQTCDVLILFANYGDTLKGALIEVGVALSMSKRIICCGCAETIGRNGTWHNHQSVFYAGAHIDDALRLLKLI